MSTMEVKMELPNTEWDLEFDEAAVTALAELERSSGEMYEDTVKTIQKIAEKPLSGSPKTGELRGFRADHIVHLVVIWELDPHITDRSQLDEVDTVYINGIGHHDEMTSIVNGKQSPAESIQEVGIQFDCHDVGKEVSQLHDLDEFTIEYEDWNGDTVDIAGYSAPDKTMRIEETLPKDTSVNLGKKKMVV